MLEEQVDRGEGKVLPDLTFSSIASPAGRATGCESNYRMV